MNPLTEWTDGYETFALSRRTPAIVYDLPKLRRTMAYLLELTAASGAECYFAVKANRSPRILAEFARGGVGVDVASGAELALALESGHSRIVATNPGLDVGTMTAVHRHGGILFLDSPEQIEACRDAEIDLAAHGVRLSLPGDYDRFGFKREELAQVTQRYGWTPSRFQIHTGEIETVAELNARLAVFGAVLDEFPGDLIDMGGGYGVLSNDREAFCTAFRNLGVFLESRGLRCALEFGKVAVARCATLVATVLISKLRDGRQSVVVDASSYNLGTLERRRPVGVSGPGEAIPTLIAGPTCYEGDVFTAAHPSRVLTAGERVMFGPCGAYAMSVAGSLHGLSPPREEFFEFGPSEGRSDAQ